MKLCVLSLAFCCLLGLSSSLSAGPEPALAGAPGARIAPRFTVNLDLPPKQRWSGVVKAYSSQILKLLALVKTVVPAEVLKVLGVVGVNVERAIPYPYSYELMGMVEMLPGVNIGDIILANTLYEVTAFSHGKAGSSKACTSIVAQAMNGSIFHGRNLDYSFVSFLRNLTITVDFQRGGKTAYTGTTFAGYIGLLTGQKPHSYTISLDERDEGQAWMNAFEALSHGGKAVAAFHIRDALDSEAFDYQQALVFLADKPLIAPCYIIIGGARPDQGAVITRDRIAVLDLWKLDTPKGEWFLVETNYDHWEPPPDSDNRRDPAIKGMDEMGRGNVGVAELLGVLSTAPVLNSGTTYTVVMSAAHPELYTTWIRDPK